MSNPRRRHRGNDRTQAFLRRQHEEREADFAAIEARYRNEIITLKDGSSVQIIQDNREAYREPVRVAPAPIPMIGRRETEDSLLDLAVAHQAHVVEAQDQRLEDEAAMKQALRDRGVTFSREPKSIHSKVPQGRIGSIPKPKIKSKRKEVDNRSIQTPDRSIDQFLSRKGLTPQKGHR